MLTGDGFLARLSPMQGGFSPDGLRAVAEAARRHGNGVLEVTSRGNLQVRGLSEASAGRLAEELDRLGLAFRSGLAVETGSLAGLDEQEIADPHPLSAQLAAAVAGKLAGLGPKISVVVDSGGRLTSSALSADIRLQAVRVDEAVLWRLSLAGTAATATPLADLSEDEACHAASRLLLAIAARGPKARARDLLEEPAELSALVGFSPPVEARSETDSAPSTTLRVVPLPRFAEEDPQRRDRRDLDPPPFMGEGDRRRQWRGPEDATSESSPAGLFPLRDGSAALGLALPFGQISAGELAAFCDAASAAGAREIRLAPQHGILALGLAVNGISALRRAAQTLGLVADPADPRLRVTACAGAPACASGVTATKDLAVELAAALPHHEPSRLHVSGCPKRCGAPAGAWELVGETPETLTLRSPGGPQHAVARGEAVAAFRRLVEPAGRETRPEEAALAARG
jgi:precorrin-3B synthase